MKLFFDTETSGKANFNAPSNHPSQPRLVQLATVLTTAECEEISTVNILVAPDGWTISDEAAKIHGITTEIAIARGINVKAAVGIFVHMAKAATTFHAYNVDFDRIIMEGEILRLAGMPNPFSTEGHKLLCEMKPMTNVCKLPGNYGRFKWPTLTESHTHCYGKPFEDAHDALGGVRAMIAVHKWRLAQVQKPLTPLPVVSP